MTEPTPTIEALADDPQLAHLSDVIVARMQSIDTIAQSGINSLTIINGGAIVAIFTMLAQGGQSSFVKHVDLRWVIAAAAAFAAGLVAIMFANLLGYYAQQMIGVFESVERGYYIRARLGHEVAPPDNRNVVRANCILWWAGAVAAVSLFAFLVGCTFAMVASLGAVG